MHGARILPAHYTDNYISLLPGEFRDISITVPESAFDRATRIGVRGWNVNGRTIYIALTAER